MNPTLKIKRFEYLIALIGYFLVALFILNQFLSSSPGTIGFFHDWPIGPFPEMNRFYANGGLYVWDSQQGNVLYPTDWIFRLSLIPFSFVDGEVLTKGVLLVVITLSGFGAFCLGKQLKLSPYSSFAAGILYIFSPIIFTRIVAGYIYYLIAYFLGPFIVTFFLKGRAEEHDNKKQKLMLQEKPEKKQLRNKNFKYFIIAGILTSFAAIQLQFLLMIPFVLLVFSVIDLRIKKSIIGLIIVCSIAVLINLSPIVLSQILYNKVLSSYFNPLQVLLSYHEVKNAASLTKSFRLLGYQSHPYGYENIGTSQDPLFESDIKQGAKNKTNSVANPDFVLVGNSINNNNNSRSTASSTHSILPPYWSDPFGNCNIIFKCTIGKFKDNTTSTSSTSRAQNNNDNNTNNFFQISTITTSNRIWSYIPGKEINVKPNQSYDILTHMKLNQFATQSHIAIEGYNETLKKWSQITQCPAGINGPLEWQEYRCWIRSIPQDTIKIRPILNAGWSSQPKQQAVTLFDDVEITEANDTSYYQSLANDLASNKTISDHLSPLISGYTKLSPTLWHIDVNNVEKKPFILSFAEPYDSSWEAIVYKDGKKVDVTKPGPLYSGINGFQINRTGDLDIVIRYGPQRWFEIGLIISGVTLAFCLFICFIAGERIKHIMSTKIDRIKDSMLNKKSR